MRGEVDPPVPGRGLRGTALGAARRGRGGPGAPLVAPVVAADRGAALPGGFALVAPPGGGGAGGGGGGGGESGFPRAGSRVRFHALSSEGALAALEDRAVEAFAAEAAGAAGAAESGDKREKQPLGGPPARPGAVLVFSCAGRGEELHGEGEAEAGGVRRAWRRASTGPANPPGGAGGGSGSSGSNGEEEEEEQLPLCGFFGVGEVGPVDVAASEDRRIGSETDRHTAAVHSFATVLAVFQ